MNRDDWKRLLMHLPWGRVAVTLYALVAPAFGISALIGMLIYEAFNDWRKKDASYKDVLGIIWGWLVGGIAIVIWS